jgi:hypothetical protein
MKKSLLFSLLCLGFGTGAYGKNSVDKKDNLQSQSATKEFSLLKDHSIIGDWSICLPFDGEYDGSGTPVVGISSAKRAIAFDADGKGQRSFSFYKDADCKSAFLEEDVNAYIVELKAWYKSQGISGIPEDAFSSLYTQLVPKSDVFTFRLVNQESGQGDLDMIRGDGQTEYTRFKVSARLLQMATTCLPEDVGSDERIECESVIGASPEERSTELDLLFFKQ